MDSLYHKIKSPIESGFVELPEVAGNIKKNLNPVLEIRPYQGEAFGYFALYLENKKLRQRPAQVLFHMATGSGKTLIMAGAMLYLLGQVPVWFNQNHALVCLSHVLQNQVF